jgi:hypothetical protein
METLKRIFAALRVFLGWADQSEQRLSPEHGWLLPAAAVLRHRPVYLTRRGR